jgi:hypothetical protein
MAIGAANSMLFCAGFFNKNINYYIYLLLWFTNDFILFMYFKNWIMWNHLFGINCLLILHHFFCFFLK